MSETKIYGASDDLIELSGQIEEEFPAYTSEEDGSHILAFSDGTLLEVTYDDDGIWRIKRLVSGSCDFKHKPGSVENDVPDEATLIGDLRWVVKSERGQYSPHIVKTSRGATP